jgi:uncharacterized protein (DUF1015 family)
MEHLGARLAPPYDVITPEQREALEASHPYNIIHIDLPREGDGLDRYTRAATLLREWQEKGVLIQEPAPALYVLEQRYRLPNGQERVRMGLIGLLRLVPWGQGVLPHERTFPHAKADRLALLAATRAQVNPIFMLYSDPAGEVMHPLLAARPEVPTAVGGDLGDEAIILRLWAVTDPQAIAAACAAMAPRTLYVADGHHRYETALTYQRQQGERNGAPSDASYHYTLIYAVAMEDPGLTILPTHRCLHDVPDFDADRLLSALEHYFEVTHYDPEVELLGELHKASRLDRVFGLVLAGRPGGYLLRLRPSASTFRTLLAQHHPAIAELDVAVLQSLVLNPILGIGHEGHEQHRFIDFEPRAQCAIAGVRAGRYQAAFLLVPTQLNQLRAIAEAGQVAPPKATFFYPKVPSGLVIYDMNHT